MPYKNKEDKLDSQRRYRERKREAKDLAKQMNSKVEDILTVLGFDSMTLSDFAEMILENCTIKEGVVIDKNTGEALKDDANVFTGWNMVVAVSTPPIVTMPEEALPALKEIGASGQQ